MASSKTSSLAWWLSEQAKLQLHAHAAGEVLDLRLGIEAKSLDESSERFAAPRGVCRAYERLDLAHLERGGEGTRVQDKTDAGA